MPAPTVALVASSIRMNEPVVRLRRYSSKNSGTGGAQRHPADLVERERVAPLVAVQRVDVEAVLQVLDQRPGGAGGVLDRQLVRPAQRGRLGHPAHHGVDVLADGGLVVGPADHVAAADVDLVGEAHVTDMGGERLVDGAVEGVDGGDPSR
jgi:hypothetical protein